MMNHLGSRFFTYYSKNKGLFVILILWVLSIVIINPAGEFPLNDDWVYLEVLKRLYYTNKLVFSEWVGSTLISQIYWALLFCKIFGYKILVIRISTLTTTFIIIIILYSLLNKLGVKKSFSLLVTSVFIFNPILYVQSFTFMTESSFNLMLILCLFASYSFINVLKIKFILTATIFGCIAVLVKQPGLIVAATLPFVLLVNKQKSKRYLFLSIASIAIIVLIYSIFWRWLNTTNYHQVNKVNQMLEQFTAGYKSWYFPQIKNTIIVTMYIGLFILPVFPVLLFLSPKAISHIKNQFHTATLRKSTSMKKINFNINYVNSVIFIIIILFSYYFTSKYQITCIENIIYNFGLGPLLLHDTFILKVNLKDFEISPQIFRWISFFSLLTGLTIILICISNFILTIFKSLKGNNSKIDQFFQLLFCSSVIFCFLLVNLYMFDRYIITLVPMVLIMFTIIAYDIINKIQIKSYLLCYILIGAMLLFEVSATHDYLAWNRAKWKALTILTKDLKVSPREIDGGYEFNGINNFNINYVQTKDKSWWWVYDDKYIVTMGMLPGYNKYIEVSYTSWVFNKKRSILVLKRI